MRLTGVKRPATSMTTPPGDEYAHIDKVIVLPDPGDPLELMCVVHAWRPNGYYTEVRAKVCMYVCVSEICLDTCVTCTHVKTVLSRFLGPARLCVHMGTGWQVKAGGT